MRVLLTLAAATIALAGVYFIREVFGAGLALWWTGIPVPLVWAILEFVVGDWPLLLGVIAVYCVVNVVLQVLVQPKFVSDAVDLSLTLSFLSVIFWAFTIGPLGAILSVPLTLLARLVLEGDPQSNWLRWISGDRTATPPQVPSSDN